MEKEARLSTQNEILQTEFIVLITFMFDVD